VNLPRLGEPAQVEIAIGAGNHKSGFAVTFSAAIFCMTSFAGNAGTKLTPAGLPANSSSAKESMW
jgi:hypothetical protein